MKKSEQILKAIKIHIEETCLVVFGEDDLNFDTDLFGEGVFDSLALVNFVVFIKESFGVEFDIDVMFSGEANSLKTLAYYIAAHVD